MGFEYHESYTTVMDSAIPYEATGRTRQKQRTRETLIGSARALIARGEMPTVEDAAAAASISRTTAYRYFRNQRELLIAAHPEIKARSLLGDHPPEDVASRFELALDELLRLTVEAEPALRAMLRLSLGSEGQQREQLLLRRGRAVGWLTDALEPARGKLSDQAIERLVYAVRSAAGIEALVWLCDVAGLSRKEGADIMRWSARALFRAALAEAGLGECRAAQDHSAATG